MSDNASETPAPKKKGKIGALLVPLVGGLVLLGAGAGGGYYVATSGLIGGHEKAKKEHKAEEPEQVDEDGDGHFDTTYFEMKKEFTSNLSDANRYIQVGLGIGTTYGAKVTDAVEKNEPAIRSAVLGVLAEQSVDGVATVTGKEALQKRLRGVINKTLEAKTGFGGVSQVYFTSFVVQ